MKYILLTILFMGITYSSYSQTPPLKDNNYFVAAGLSISDDMLASGTDIDSNSNEVDSQDLQTNDTLSINNRIENIWEANNKVFVRVQLIENNTPVELKLFNMLGKEVVNIYKGSADNGDTFEFDANLQNGIYICVMTGPNIKEAEKLILSR